MFSIYAENEDSPPLSKPPMNNLKANHLSTTPITPAGNIVDMQGSISQSTPQNGNETESSPSNFPSTLDSNIEVNVQSPSSVETNYEENSDSLKTVEESAQEEQQKIDGDKSNETSPDGQCYSNPDGQEYVNQRGIRFTPEMQEDVSLLPYGLACVRELLRYHYIRKSN